GLIHCISGRLIMAPDFRRNAWWSDEEYALAPDHGPSTQASIPRRRPVTTSSLRIRSYRLPLDGPAGASALELACATFVPPSCDAFSRPRLRKATKSGGSINPPCAPSRSPDGERMT